MPLKCAPFMHWSTHGRRMRWQSLSQKVEGLASAVMHGIRIGYTAVGSQSSLRLFSSAQAMSEAS